MPKQQKHKAATEVSIFRQEKSLLQQWVDKYWKPAALIAVLGTAAILFLQYRSQTELASRGEDWNVLNEALRADDDAQLDEAIAALKGKKEEPWALFSKAQRAILNEKPDDALAALDALASLGDNQAAILAKTKLPFGPDGTELELASYLREQLSAQKAWDEAHPVLVNPDPAEGSPKVILETDEGAIEVTLYLDIAPLHAKNFIKRCQAGEYDGTKFHKVLGALVSGGDPESKNADPATWGSGGADEPKIAREKNGLVMAKGYLAGQMDSTFAKESHGTMFVLTAGPAHQQAANSTVFGKVTSGLEVLESIAEGDLLPYDQQNPTQYGRPEEPVTLLSTKVIGL